MASRRKRPSPSTGGACDERERQPAIGVLAALLVAVMSPVACRGRSAPALFTAVDRPAADTMPTGSKTPSYWHPTNPLRVVPQVRDSEVDSYAVVGGRYATFRRYGFVGVVELSSNKVVHMLPGQLLNVGPEPHTITIRDAGSPSRARVVNLGHGYPVCAATVPAGTIVDVSYRPPKLAMPVEEAEFTASHVAYSLSLPREGVMVLKGGMLVLTEHGCSDDWRDTSSRRSVELGSPFSGYVGPEAFWIEAPPNAPTLSVVAIAGCPQCRRGTPYRQARLEIPIGSFRPGAWREIPVAVPRGALATLANHPAARRQTPSVSIASLLKWTAPLAHSSQTHDWLVSGAGATRWRAIRLTDPRATFEAGMPELPTQHLLPCGARISEEDPTALLDREGRLIAHWFDFDQEGWALVTSEGDFVGSAGVERHLAWFRQDGEIASAEQVRSRRHLDRVRSRMRRELACL